MSHPCPKPMSGLDQFAQSLRVSVIDIIFDLENTLQHNDHLLPSTREVIEQCSADLRKLVSE